MLVIVGSQDAAPQRCSQQDKTCKFPTRTRGINAHAGLRMPASVWSQKIQDQKLPRSVMNLQGAEDKPQSGIDDLKMHLASEQKVMRADKKVLICVQQELQQQVAQWQQQPEGADGVTVVMKVLHDDSVNCSVTAVKLQPANHPTSKHGVTSTSRDCSVSEIGSADDESQVHCVESAGKGASSNSHLADVDANCNVVLAMATSKQDENVKDIRTYCSKRAESGVQVTDAKCSGVANKGSSRWWSSSHNHRLSLRQGLLGAALSSLSEKAVVSAVAELSYKAMLYAGSWECSPSMSMSGGLSHTVHQFVQQT